jgi:hypothetical protein
MKGGGSSWWARVARRLPSRRGSIAVYHPPGEERWAELAPAYWEGRLGGLALVQSSRFTVVHRGRAGPGGPDCYFKRFLVRSLGDWLKHRLRSSRARRALGGGERLRALGFLAPRPLCLIEERRLSGVLESALVTEAVSGAANLRDALLRPELAVAGTLDRRRRLLRAFGRALAAWHGAGICHGDLRLGNVLCRELGDGFEFISIDNERTRRGRSVPLRLRARNLIQANMDQGGISWTDRRRVFEAYCAASGLAPDRARWLLRRVVRRTRERWAYIAGVRARRAERARRRARA